MKNIFKEEAPKYWDKGLTVCAVLPVTKQGPKDWNNFIDQLPSQQTKDKWFNQYPDAGVALLTGKRIGNGQIIIGIDIDDPAYVEAISRFVGNFPSGKIGEKGLTIFARTDESVKSKMSISGKLDILVRSLCVLPPTIHPKTNKPYTWAGLPLTDIELTNLPHLSADRLNLLVDIIKHGEHAIIMEGESTHDAALTLMAKLAGKFDNEEMVVSGVSAFFPEGYKGNTLKELPEMFRSAKNKGLGNVTRELVYDPRDTGPIPRGYTDNGHYVLQHQIKRILAVLPSSVLMSEAGLCDLAPMKFWMDFCPKLNKDGIPTGSIDAKAIGDHLMELCRDAGPFIASKVRGTGTWREGDRIIENFRGPLPQSDDYTYMRFAPLPPFQNDLKVNARSVLDFFRLFRWSDKGMAMLLLGWVACAPICGALKWRTHVFVNGPKNTGKSTLIKAISDLLNPMATNVDGTSSEAGVRQSIGADSKPVIMDEFESDGNLTRMRNILKLIRSASSAAAPIARGTPEGRALQFQISCSFLLGAIIPIKGSSADASRIIELDLERHDNDRGQKAKIDEGLKMMMDTLSAWPNQMVTLCHPILKSIDTFERAMPSGDLRHNLNMATLLGGAFTALHEREVTEEEAVDWVAEYLTLWKKLAEAHKQDEGMDCLHHLLCSKQGDSTVGDMLRGTDITNPSGAIPVSDGPSTVALAKIGIKVRDDGFLIANRHPELSKIFGDTLWADGNWGTALGRLPGAKKDATLRARFSGGPQTRCTFIPISCLDGKDDEAEPDEA